MPFDVGQSVGDYEILAVLGEGGMGAVYRVRNTISNRVEAMKVLLADVSAQAELGDRFVSEIRTLARLEHPNIAKFHTAFKVENQLVMVMEFVEGFTLSGFADQAAIPIDQVLSYVSQTLSALTCAHVNGVVHRDIKPSNIMVTSHGVVKLMDFGIAKSNVDPNLTRPGTTIGSVRYMSPEQVQGENVDARSDLYSLGIVLYELTAGKRPFESENTFDLLNAHLNVPPRPPIELNPQMPQALNEIILLAIEKDPERRFQTAAAFRNALENVRQRPGSAPAQPAVGPERDLTTPMPSSSPYAQTVVDSAVSANPGTAGSQQYQPIMHQSFGSQPPTPAAKKGNRGLWMAAGAIACVCVFGAAVYIVPNLLKSPVASSSKPDSRQRDTSVVPKTTATTTTAPVVSAPANDRATAVNPSPAKQQAAAIRLSAVHPATQITKTDSAPKPAEPPPAPPQTSVAPPPAPQPPAQPAISQEDMDKAGEDLMKLRARADAVRSSLDNLRAEQASQGLGLRQDIAAAASRMDSYLRESDHALQSGRLDFARKNMEHADEEITKIEAFFGR